MTSIYFLCILPLHFRSISFQQPAMLWPSAHKWRRRFIEQSIWRLFDNAAWQGFAWIMMIDNQLKKHQHWHLCLQSPLCFRKTLAKMSLSHCTALRVTEMSSFVLVISWQIIWRIVSVTMEVSAFWKTKHLSFCLCNDMFCQHLFNLILWTSRLLMIGIFTNDLPF